MLIILPATMASANDGCRTGAQDDPCDLAIYYAAIGDDQLPQEFDEFGVAFTIDSAYADGPKLVVSGTTALSKAKLEEVMRSNKGKLSDLQRMVDDSLPDAICSTVEGPDFIDAGGQVVVEISSADGAQLVSSTVQTCPGGS